MASPIDLPLSITSEIIKSKLDSEIMLNKNTKLAFSRIGGVFVLYISHLANEICKSKGKSKLTLDDLKEALNKAGFSDFIEKIDSDLEEYEKNEMENIENINEKSNDLNENKNNKEVEKLELDLKL